MKNRAQISKERSWAMYPFALILMVLPFIMHAKIISVTGTEYYEYWFGQATANDIFGYYRAILFVVLSVASIGIALAVKRNQNPLLNFKNSLDQCVVLLSVAVLASLLLSKTKEIALFGMIERYEGTIIWICYLGVFLAGKKLIHSKEQFNRLIKLFLISSIVMSTIGILQSKGMNFFLMPGIKELIFGQLVPSADQNLKAMAFAALYNPNYVGVYCSMTVMLSAYYVVDKGIKSNYIGISSIILNVIFLIFSQSEGGLLGVTCACVFAGYFYLIAKAKVESRKKVIVGTVVLLTVIILFATATNVKSIIDFFDTTKSVSYSQKGPLKRYEILQDGTAVVNIMGEEVHIKEKNGEVRYYNSQDQLLVTGYDQASGNVTFTKSTYNLKSRIYAIKNGPTILSVGKGTCYVIFVLKEDGIHIADAAGRPTKLQNPEHIGFVNQENFATKRGYIWSRSIPLLKKYIVYGAGADCFITVFPQREAFAKAYLYGTPLIAVDKPHNAYIQLAINFGCLAMIVYVIMQLTIIRNCVLNVLRESKPLSGIFVASMMVAYGITMIANDSTVFVSPLYWTLIGMIASVYALPPNNARLKDEK